MRPDKIIYDDLLDSQSYMLRGINKSTTSSTMVQKALKHGREEAYDIAFKTLLHLHKKTPTVLEVCMYLMYTEDKGINNIVDILDKKKEVDANKG